MDLLRRRHRRDRACPDPAGAPSASLIGRLGNALRTVQLQRCRLNQVGSGWNLCPLHRDEREAGYDGAVNCCSCIAAQRADYCHSGKQGSDGTEDHFKWDHMIFTETAPRN